ncbi:glycerol transporter [Ciborinia camelliae]|nr:glycerol transporter [Ciborinia camelliae]
MHMPTAIPNTYPATMPCQAQIRGEDDEEEDEMDGWRGIGTREEDFEEGEGGVEAVFGDVGPGVEAERKPACGDFGPEDDAPVDQRDEDRVADDAAVVEGVQGLEGAWEFVQEGGSTAERVGKCVKGGEGKVEGYAPVAED